MADFSVVRDALIARLETIDGLRACDGSGAINPPAAVVAPAPGTVIDYDTSTGSDDMLFVVTVLVARASDRAGLDTLNAYLATTGARSVPAAINGDLGGAAGVDWAIVREARNYGSRTVADVDYLGVEFAVRVGVT